MNRRVETVVFNGIRYRRYPDAAQQCDQRYYVAGIADRQRGATRLHQDIWRLHNGDIPEGYHVHHDDGDHDNNDPSNLVAIPDCDHREHHVEERRASGQYVRPERLEHLERIRPMASEWHSSSEGLAWHAENGKKSWETRTYRDETCEQCGKTYSTRAVQSHDRFCSNACKSAWRRAAGLDDEDRTCEQCGATFRINKYSGTRNCSRRCAALGRRRDRSA